MASLMPNGKQQYFDNNGNNLAGGKLYAFEAGTSTPLETYSDQAGAVPNTHPVVLNARGEATIFWGADPYKIVLKDASDVEIWTQDNCYAQADAKGLADAIAVRTPEIGNYAALRAYAGSTTAFYVRGHSSLFDGGAGVFRVDSSDTTTADNGGTVLVDSSGRRWKRDTFEAPSVKWFGAKGDGSTDDTAAIQDAFDYVDTLREAALTESGSLSTSFSGFVPTLFFPRGRYNLTADVAVGAYCVVYGEDAIIDQLTDTEDIFTCSVYQVEFRNLQFVGGRHHLYLSNANINSTLISVEKCQFFLSRSYAIKTEATGGVWTHMSAQLTIDKCRFLACNKIIDNCCDDAVISNSWMQMSKTNFTASTAAIQNKGKSVLDPDALTRMHIKDSFLIPDVGTEGVDRVNNVRWIDNYGAFMATNARFGGETGGMSILWQLDGYNEDFPWTTTEAVFERCVLFAGPDARADSCVVGIQGHVPNRVTVKNCSGPVGKPIIANLSSLNIATYLSGFESATGKKAYEYFKIDINDAITDINAYTPTRSWIPDALYPYLIKGRQTRVRRAATQSMANALATNNVSFDTIDFDNLGAFDVANPTRLLMPKGCSKMRITMFARMAVDGATKLMQFRIDDSTGNIVSSDTSLRGINGNSDEASVSAEVSGVPGSYWQINIRHNAAGSLNLTECRVSITPLDQVG